MNEIKNVIRNTINEVADWATQNSTDNSTDHSVYNLTSGDIRILKNPTGRSIFTSIERVMENE